MILTGKDLWNCINNVLAVYPAIAVQHLTKKCLVEGGRLTCINAGCGFFPLLLSK